MAFMFHVCAYFCFVVTCAKTNNKRNRPLSRLVCFMNSQGGKTVSSVRLWVVWTRLSIPLRQCDKSTRTNWQAQRNLRFGVPRSGAGRFRLTALGLCNCSDTCALQVLACWGLGSGACTSSWKFYIISVFIIAFWWQCNGQYFSIYTNDRDVLKGDQLLQCSFVHWSALPSCESVKHTGAVFLLLLVLAQEATKQNWVQT